MSRELFASLERNPYHPSKPGTSMKIQLSLRSVRAGPVPALAGKTGSTISTVTAQGLPRVAPLRSFFIRSGEPKDHGDIVETARRAVSTKSLQWFGCGSAALCLFLSLFLSGCAHQDEPP